MTVTSDQPTAKTGELLPAKLADTQLDHFERMVQIVTRTDAATAANRFDADYWEKRIRALVKTHDLVTTQRCRVITMLDLLERHALIKAREGTAA
ncbi:hypothetical protein FAZ95_38520 [Trinickia violacea]|uniref:Uncharacterized protein n=1 Tax=Trinickia violacea TaxID=2571746 RepID=A0A4V1EIS1_9BURK|nr:hypothetical protein [Trinickia violacea]QCP54750.1 hypothetical protein FAZ95_38520 [Trinickia violacea]